jgi:hypothetical protein
MYFEITDYSTRLSLLPSVRWWLWLSCFVLFSAVDWAVAECWDTAGMARGGNLGADESPVALVTNFSMSTQVSQGHPKQQ